MLVTPALIDVRHAAFGYGDRVVVDDVSFTLTSGEVMALLGPNGSGKSTLVKGLLGLIPVLRGEVDLFGVPVADLHDRTRVGYVPQRHTLSNAVRATVREIVATGRLPHRPWWRPASATDRRLVNEAIAAVGLDDRADHDVATLSGGQQRRVLIARALAGQPDVLIMDEPTAGVDHASQDVLAGDLARLAATGTSMLIVTHELEALEGVVNRIVCMDAGRIDFDGSPQAYAEAGDDHGESHRRGGGIACGPDGHPLEPAQTSAILGADPAPVAATSATERVG